MTLENSSDITTISVLDMVMSLCGWTSAYPGESANQKKGDATAEIAWPLSDVLESRHMQTVHIKPAWVQVLAFLLLALEF